MFYSETDFSSSSSDTYYTAEESEYYFNPDEHDCEDEEVFYLNDVEKTKVECSVNDESVLSREKLCPEPESSENNYEENDFDNIEKQNDVNFKRRKSEYLPNNETNNDNGHFRSKNSAYICDEKSYNDILHHADNSFEKKESKGEKDFSSESYGENENFSSSNLARSYDDNELEDKCSTNTLEFEDVNNKYCQKQGLKKYNTFEDLSDSKQEQYLKKHDSLENLSRFEDNEKYEKDFPCDNPEIGTDSYECEIEVRFKT